VTPQPAKRRYRNALEQIEEGLHACWQNAQDLVKASDQLLAAELHAPALSLAVLALEELAKLVAIDGLLFARPDDWKADDFKKATKSHAVKLSILEVLPLLLRHLAMFDPRWTEPTFKLVLTAGITQLVEDGDAVMAEMPDGSFQMLDDWKQRGFYAACTDSGFVASSSAVPPTLAQKVRQLAWRATTTLDFLLKGGNLERYIQEARSIRGELSEQQLQALEALGAQMATERFAASETKDNKDGEED